MLKTITITVTAAAVSALLTVGASAAPLAPAKQFGIESNITLVRDGCGRGMRYSNSRDRCVEKFSRGSRHFDRGSRWSDRGRHHRRNFRNDDDVGQAIIHGLFGGGRTHW